MVKPELLKHSIETSPQPTEGQAAADRIAAARKLVDSGSSTEDARRPVRNPVTGSVSANDLANPPQQAPVTPVPEPQLPSQNAGTVNNVLGSIQSTSENAQRLAEEQAGFQSFVDESSGFDIQNAQLERFGVTPDKLARLEDIQLQLNNANTASGLQKVEIQSGGQGAIQGGRSLTQEDRENEVRNSGLAAEAAILQGNIETGRALANDAVNIAMQDRTFQATAQLQAISDLKDVVGEETRQLLVEEERVYTQELADIERVKTAVDTAMASGAATADDIKVLTDPKLSDEEKLAAAQEIVARKAREDRELDIRERNSIITDRLSGGSTVNTVTGETLQVPTFDEYAAENAGRAYALGGLSAEQIETLRKEYEADVDVMNQANAVSKLSPLAAELVKNPKGYFDLTATRRGEVLEELANAGIDTALIQKGKKRELATSQVEDMRQAQLAKENVETLYDMLNDLPGTGPVAGRLAALDPYSTEYKRVQAQINRTVPGLARGIFQEVGVLTDTDVNRYTTTLANPNATTDQIEALHNDTMRLIDESISSGLKLYSDLGYELGGLDLGDGETSVPEDGLTDDEAYEEYLNQQS